MNYRTHSVEELQSAHLCAWNDPVQLAEVREEFIRRFNVGLMIDALHAEAEADEQSANSWDHGYSEGQCDERELVKESIIETLCFHFKDKIEADAIDELIDWINHNWPKLPTTKERD